jgi:hypothetical protein
MIDKNRKTAIAILIPILVILVITVPNILRNQPDEPEIVDNGGNDGDDIQEIKNVIFRIGHETDEEIEFDEESEYQEEYSCEIGADFSNETFPCGQQRLDYPSPLEGYASKIEIIFQLEEKIDNPVLYLQRAGSETTEISIDGGEKVVVTAKTLGSMEGGIIGTHHLALNSLDAGSHNVVLTVGDDENGNGIFGWQAIVLYSDD